MSRLGGMMRSTRPKKLTPKQPIPIYRDHQIDLAEDDLQTTLQNIETGVEKAEESEYHLQAAINAASLGNASQKAHIPTPETVTSSLQYDKLYPPTFSQPATYIRFSSTVEDCCGCPYNMVEEDDIALKIMNQKADASTQCTEDQFEELMSFFEETAHTKQPFAAVDNPPVIPYEEMEECFDGIDDENLKKFSKGVYEHWKLRRNKLGNCPLQPSLKFECGQDTDDSDPYVCFRRREVRQARKTRGRDAQSAEKLRRLRKELEDARQLVALVRQREIARKEQFTIDRQLFMQRAEVKEMKRKLGITDDDEDLINQKPKKKPTEVATTARPTIPQLRTPARPAGQPVDELRLLEDVQADKENEISRDIKQNVVKHAKWNEGYVDMTRAPLTPKPPQQTFDGSDFRPAITEYLPTPPTSESSDAMQDVSREGPDDKFAVIHKTTDTTDDQSRRGMPCFRRRIGRGGRTMIDRRNLPFRSRNDIDPLQLDRFKYDQDDDEVDPVYERDEFNTQIMQHRAYLHAKSSRDQAIQAQLQAQAQAAAQNGRRLLVGSQGGGTPTAPNPPPKAPQPSSLNPLPS
ncbi:histone acetyltransferase complex component Epl1, variant [Coccidioides immitis RS]|uniref:Enhancer of polycomb-like protein n=1 Tax=Coccidioides immitis (strain RS) TaxID=246410 RepID=A0A0D8JRI3_COCIM|nr:histone acetyltransferase complex component Epl1, variant [Coccidioides immitis RS]KJF59960.1 histone acetyltransferase complex component Epl1, variant [Coccidioides immitis RS]